MGEGLIVKENEPLVSIIMPSYNHEKFISQAVHSIMNQTYRKFELIVLDDGSSDSSRDILSVLNKQYPFTLVFQDNMGLSRTLNKGIKEYSKGEYVSLCASDDYWMPDKLEKQVAFMGKHPDIPMCYGKIYIIDEKGNILKLPTWSRNRGLRGGYIFKDILLLNFFPPPGNYLFKKSVFEDIGYYKDSIFTEDYYLALKLSKKYDIGYIDDYLSYYRRVNKPFTMKTSISHLECINEYADSEFYQIAITKWHLRNFFWYAPYKQYKGYAMKSMLQSMQYICSIYYLRALIRLLVCWR